MAGQVAKGLCLALSSSYTVSCQGVGFTQGSGTGAEWHQTVVAP